MARAVLADDGFCVVGEAADAESGLAVARELRPDCVLLDVQLGDADGFALAEALAVADERPAVVMTSGRDREDFEALIGASASCGFIPKEGTTVGVCAGGASAVSFAVAPVATPRERALLPRR